MGIHQPPTVSCLHRMVRARFCQDRRLFTVDLQSGMCEILGQDAGGKDSMNRVRVENPVGVERCGCLLHCVQDCDFSLFSGASFSLYPRLALWYRLWRVAMTSPPFFTPPTFFSPHLTSPEGIVCMSRFFLHHIHSRKCPSEHPLNL